MNITFAVVIPKDEYKVLKGNKPGNLKCVE
jgi:hypothetical protein